MTNAFDLAQTIALACETGDRTDPEHKALLRVAERLDTERNANTTSNRRRDRSALPVACTAPWHTGVDKCRTCSTMDPAVRLNVVPFTSAAKREPLTDDDGWSIAAYFVDATRT